jgi:hypothetical protein
MKNNNYPTWLVPIEIAKELKGIGFNEECNFVLTKSNKIGFTSKNNGNHHFIEDLDKCDYNSIDMVSVPTCTEVFEWFREEGYDSYIGLESHSYIDEGNYYYFEITKSNLYNISQLDWKGDFDDYNEAREALVKALIRTYKQEQPIMDENE